MFAKPSRRAPERPPSSNPGGRLPLLPAAWPRLRALARAALVSAMTAAGFTVPAAWSLPAYAIDPPPLLRDWGPMWERGGWDGWEAHLMVLWPVFLLLGVLAVIFVVMRLYLEIWPGSLHVSPRAPVASGHQILAERFARGEIDEREYREKRKALGKR